jgi:hypothetical protein
MQGPSKNPREEPRKSMIAKTPTTLHPTPHHSLTHSLTSSHYRHYPPASVAVAFSLLSLLGHGGNVCLIPAHRRGGQVVFIHVARPHRPAV